jgi:hypothetical protein
MTHVFREIINELDSRNVLFAEKRFWLVIDYLDREDYNLKVTCDHLLRQHLISRSDLDWIEQIHTRTQPHRRILLLCTNRRVMPPAESLPKAWNRDQTQRLIRFNPFEFKS